MNRDEYQALEAAFLNEREKGGDAPKGGA